MNKYPSSIFPEIPDALQSKGGTPVMSKAQYPGRGIRQSCRTVQEWSSAF